MAKILAAKSLIMFQRRQGVTKIHSHRLSQQTQQHLTAVLPFPLTKGVCFCHFNEHREKKSRHAERFPLASAVEDDTVTTMGFKLCFTYYLLETSNEHDTSGHRAAFSAVFSPANKCKSSESKTKGEQGRRLRNRRCAA